MKHPSKWLTVLLLGAMPLAAAALDYGPNRTLLAAEDGASQLPGAQLHAASTGAIPKPDAIEADADDATGGVSAVPRAAPSGAPASAVAAPHGHATSTRNQPHRAPPPAIEPDPASWRSLLPGSIQ